MARRHRLADPRCSGVSLKAFGDLSAQIRDIAAQIRPPGISREKIGALYG
jgi:hypothetical protein